MKDDTSSPLNEVGAQTPESLSSRICEIQRKAEFVQHKMAMRLCVQVEMAAEDDLGDKNTPIELRHHHSDKYIAVSCPWQLGCYIMSGRYRFSPEQRAGIIMPQDVVLDRVLNFRACNPEYRDTPFWIDKLCINQDASDEKEMALHSMDLVYQYSRCTLGLLFVRMSSLAQVTLLRNLLDGKFAEDKDNGLQLLISVEEANSVLELIEMILQDDWWQRAWIFQEEFLASKHMILLIPCSLDRRGLFENAEKVDLFGKTSGEIEVSALNFRTEVTTFCLALSRHADKTGRDRCSHILKVARRYTLLYRSNNTAGPHSIVRAMSPAIFDDIGFRGITILSDILAITANCCRYTARLDAKALNETDESLSAAILTLFLINGEILRHDTPSRDILSKSVFECLQSEKLHIHPPIQSKELIFIKNCRLHSVKMTSTGIITRGVLSRLDKTIDVKVLASEQDLYWRSNKPEEIAMLNDAEIGLIRALARKLEKDRCTALAGLLRVFSDAKSTGVAPQFWCSDHIKVMMAKYVCRAIAERRSLRLARVHIQGKWTPYVGVFVPEAPFDDSAATFAFTSLEPDNEYKNRGTTLARKNARCASLEVSFAPDAQIVPMRWMNGLCFFNNQSHPRNLMIPWPHWMHTTAAETNAREVRSSVPRSGRSRESGPATEVPREAPMAEGSEANPSRP